jgi:hypothetical protein
MAKQEGQETVAKRDPQNWHSGLSVEVAAPQFGQLSDSACILHILSENAVWPCLRRKRRAKYKVSKYSLEISSALRLFA